MTAVPNSHLVITTLGSNKPKLVNQFMQAISNCGGNILDTRMTTLGNEFGIILLVEGSWRAVAKIEATLPVLDKKLELISNMRRTTPANEPEKSITYLVHAVTSADRDGILNELTQFFTLQNINITDINNQIYLANGGTRMASMTINVNIPVNMHMPSLRDKFMHYCDALNLDAGLEPLRA